MSPTISENASFSSFVERMLEGAPSVRSDHHSQANAGYPCGIHRMTRADRLRGRISSDLRPDRWRISPPLC
jgi:hypothetical protein